MDPNVTLETIRDIARQWREGAIDGRTMDDRTKVAEMVDAFTALDNWLTRGGFQPDEWKFAPAITPVERREQLEGVNYDGGSE